MGGSHWSEIATIVWPEFGGPTSVAVAAVVVFLAALAASGHAVLYKRDSRGATLWVVLIWSFPVFGSVLYFTFGINRIKRRAVLLRRRIEAHRAEIGRTLGSVVGEPVDRALGENLAPLVKIGREVTPRPLLAGNRIETLVNGEAAFPEMLAAIGSARHSISLSSYIFERDDVGLRFAAALGAAVDRGVEVRVLIDATGTLLTWRPILGTLRRHGVRYARFLPALSLGQPVSLNLRNHRKILVVDGTVGFTGGMNLCTGHGRKKDSSPAAVDVHFRVTGPVVAHLQEAFVEDWLFTTEETLGGPKWLPALRAEGEVLARGIADGPDEGLEKSRWIILAAITAARRSLRIVTPYFLPDGTIISALNLAAMRGVAVDIVLPSEGDIPFVHWASRAHWWQMLEHGCRIWISPPPFDHSKIFVVDEAWVLVGSTNWDPRSLRLNFEFNLECCDRALAISLGALCDEKKSRARIVTQEEVDGRSLPVRLRDGVARLFTPFL